MGKLIPTFFKLSIISDHASCSLLEEYSQTEQNLLQTLCTGNSKKTLKLDANFFHVCEHTKLVIHSIKSIWRSPNYIQGRSNDSRYILHKQFTEKSSSEHYETERAKRASNISN
jgi:hypothetical protein